MNDLITATENSPEHRLTAAQFQSLAEVPAAAEWFDTHFTLRTGIKGRKAAVPGLLNRLISDAGSAISQCEMLGQGQMVR